MVEKWVARRIRNGRFPPDPSRLAEANIYMATKWQKACGIGHSRIPLKLPGCTEVGHAKSGDYRQLSTQRSSALMDCAPFSCANGVISAFHVGI